MSSFAVDDGGTIDEALVIDTSSCCFLVIDMEDVINGFSSSIMIFETFMLAGRPTWRVNRAGRAVYGCSWPSPLDGDGEHGKQGSEVNRVIAFCFSIRRGGGGVVKYREMPEISSQSPILYKWNPFSRMVKPANSGVVEYLCAPSANSSNQRLINSI
ncbi:hypothetical protein NC651_019608 [Populus alba x Populus x berolinensis]|nr:hypothetical protein NC651_019121 [Populus alba x Populus x berolinensis]KAJ6901274.1 hypothetical protein NC651_019126 [Populus alba x Populus x berolinensis]KAJ6901873.1 hypothetical protein NC651_019608 [Populus alba x Populus x berolinensis]